MKKTVTALAVFIMLLLTALTAQAYDFSEIETTNADGFYTVITDVDGGTYRAEGIVNAESIEKIGTVSSYAIYENDEEFMNVTIRNIALPMEQSVSGNSLLNGYYAVKFTLSETDNTTAFLTGLTGSNVSEVQTQLINARLENSAFSMESLDFIDTEKTNIKGHGDDLLCWAATACNMLWYTGWGERAPFGSEDDIFDLYNDNFSDLGSTVHYGLQWFFNGSYRPQTWSGFSKVKNYGNNGGYFKNYFWKDLVTDLDISPNHKNMTVAKDTIENGGGVGVSLSWLTDSGTRNGGHAITMWGYICDNDYAETDANYFKAIIVSDSDSDRINNADRRVAPNKLAVLNMTPFTKFGYDSWSFDGYGGVLASCALLEPYSDTAMSETDSSATLDTINNSEFYIDKLSISNDDQVDAKSDIISTNGDVTFSFTITNYSDASFSGAMDCLIEIADKNTGESVISQPISFNTSIAPYSGIIPSIAMPDMNLPQGEYTLSVTTNQNKSTAEAYYYNNTCSIGFTAAEFPFDASSAVMSAEVGQFSGMSATVKLNYTGLDNIGGYYNTYDVYAAYQSDGEWDDFSKLVSSKSAPPKSCTVKSEGEKVKFKLVAKGDGVPNVIINSAEYDLTYTKLVTVSDTSNTGKYTRLGRSAKSLYGNEKFSFRIKNASTDKTSSAATGTVRVYAVQKGKKTQLYSGDISVNFGETSNIITVTSWEAELSGTYSVVAEVSGNFGSSTLALGTLYVKERASTVVTSSGDTTNPYDNLVTLREAVAYAKENGGGEITFDITGGSVYLMIGSAVTIDCPVTVSAPEDQLIVLYGSDKTKIFNITANGTLKADNLFISHTTGGVVNNGGTAEVSNCAFTYCQSSTNGGAVYSSGGNVKLKNCNFRSNSASDGGAVYVTDSAYLEMLNCNVTYNSSKGGAVTNSGASASVVYSTLFGNTAPAGAVVSSGGTVNMTGCMSALNSKADMSGEVKLNGTYYSNANVTADEYSVCGSGLRAFICGADGAVVNAYKSGTKYQLYMSPAVKTGVYVKNDGGYIAYSKDKDTWLTTDIETSFTDTDYAYDSMGDAHGAMLGSTWKTPSQPMFVNSYNGKLSVYMPETAQTSLIEKTDSASGEMLDAAVCASSLDIGTNIIDIPQDTADGIKTYLLWKNMIPLCKPSKIQ